MSLSFDVSARFTAPGATPFDVDVRLDVAEGETLVVLGPSGSGKTLLLETVAGYHEHGGAVRAGGHDVTDESPEARGFGFVFQDYALFPHMTVRENVAFGTRYHAEGRDPDALLDELAIAHLADRRPPTLSGGEAQRVALARSLAIRPSVLLLDEPLSALDVPTRESLRTDLAGILDDVTALYVTHNRTTARELGDRIAVMRAGSVVQVGPAESVFLRPANPFVARFTGGNCVPAAAWSAALDGEAEPASTGATGRHGGGLLAVRPEHVHVGEGGAAATVERVTRRDFGARVTLARHGSVIDVFTPSPPTDQSETTVRFPPDHVIRFPSGSDDSAVGASLGGRHRKPGPVE